MSGSPLVLPVIKMMAPKKTQIREQHSPKWRCALRRAKRRPAPARLIHAPAPRMPISTAHLHDTHAKSAHAQCTAAQYTTCAHTIAAPDTAHAHTLLQHARQPGKRTRRQAPERPQRLAAALTPPLPPAQHPLICHIPAVEQQQQQLVLLGHLHVEHADHRRQRPLRRRKQVRARSQPQLRRRPPSISRSAAALSRETYARATFPHTPRSIPVPFL
eukprot:7379528-Prymnesium_polylepis.1